MSQTIYEMVTSTIIAALNKGVIPWRKPWNAQSSTPVNAVSNKGYRGVNLFLLGMAPYEDHRWLTIRQANELGGRAKAGETPTVVIFWKHWEPKENEVEPDRKARIPILRYYKVFNAEQCEDLRLPALYRPQPLMPHERIQRAELLIESMADKPAIKEGGKSAWYRPRDDLIRMPPLDSFESADAFYATLFHELGHATGHEKRLARAGVTGEIKFGSGEYSKEELVAELTSAFCCATVSLDNSLMDGAASYISGWLSVLKADPKAVVIAAAQAQKAADYIRGVTYQ